MFLSVKTVFQQLPSIIVSHDKTILHEYMTMLFIKVHFDVICYYMHELASTFQKELRCCMFVTCQMNIVSTFYL